MTLNDIAWESAFEKYGLLETVDHDGQAFVSAQQLRIFREPRLMAKVDHSKDLPDIFQVNRLSILPTSNAGYTIGRFKTFHPIESSSSIPASTFPTPGHIETINFQEFSSEPAVLHAAYASKVLEDFVGEELFLTTSGRMRSGYFSFTIDTFTGQKESIDVKNAQIEIDAGYENKTALTIFEAKNHAAVDFNIRQLFYPLKTWERRTTKQVRAAYLMASKGEFEILEYSFQDLTDMSSLSLLKAKRYVFAPPRIELEDFVEVAKHSLGAMPNHSVPFPQANNINRVIDLVSVLIEHPQSADALTHYYGFDKRQSKYYIDAAMYLGLADKRKNKQSKSVWVATSLAKGLFRLGTDARNAEIAKLILSFDSFATVFLEYVKSDRKPSPTIVVELLNSSPDFEYYSGDTVPRRASTVKSWCEWVVDLTKI